MKEKLLSSLKPLYAEMLNGMSIDDNTATVTFCMQWGADFPVNAFDGILFVGRATNGWMGYSKDLEILFGETEDAIFARKDQMRWVKEHEGVQYDETGKKLYNTNGSAFWRVIKGVSQSIYGDKWYDRIAWSNLYKISCEVLNPTGKMFGEQLDVCKKILKTEIEILSPRFVVFLTADWEEGFVTYLNGNKECDWIESHQWGDNNETSMCIINNTVIISSHHPQGKNEYNHIKTIVDIIKRY